MPRKYVKQWERGQWPRPSLEESFWQRANKKSEFECWLWSGGKNDDGYGVLRGRTMHRYSYELHKGPIPAGLEIDHLCSVRNCVNPAHLEAVSHQENIRRSWDRGNCESRRNRLGKWQLSKTHCSNGHEYSRENVVLDSTSGARRCRICEKAKSARYMAKKRAIK